MAGEEFGGDWGYSDPPSVDWSWFQDPPSGGSGWDWGAPGGNGTPFDWGGILNGLGGINLGGLLGALGPLLGMGGNLLGGGRTGPSSSSGNQSGTSNNQNWGQQGNQNWNQGNSSNQNMSNQFSQMFPQLFPQAMGGGQNAQSALDFMAPGAMQGWQQGIGMLQGPGSAFAMGTSPLQVGQQGLLSQINPYLQQMMGSNTGAPVEQYLQQMMRSQQGASQVPSFPGMPSTPSPELLATVNSAFDPYVGDITANAITNARNRGFSGGADLLGGPAAQMAGQGLANVPGMKAAQVLKSMIDIPMAQANIASQEANALAQARGLDISSQGQVLQGLLGNRGMDITSQNSILQGLMGGAGAFNTPIGQQQAFLSQLSQQLMNPMGQQVQGNLGLLTGYPVGQQSYNQGQGANQGITSNQGGNQGWNQGGNQGATSGNQSGANQPGAIPWQQLLGQGLMSVLQGGAAGNASYDQSQMNQMIQQILQLFAQGRNLGGGG